MLRGRDTERGNAVVAVLVVVGICLAGAAGVRYLGSATSETYRAQGEAVRGIGGGASSSGGARLPPPPGGEERAATDSDVFTVGANFGKAGAWSFYEGLQGISNLVNPLSGDFIGARLNSAGLALANLFIHPSQQLERESTALGGMWEGVKGVAASAHSTISGGSPESQAVLAGAIFGSVFDPFKGFGKVGRLGRWGRAVDDAPAARADDAPAARADDAPANRTDVEPRAARPEKDTSALTSSAARDHLAEAGIGGARQQRFLESFADAGLGADEIVAMSPAQLRALRRADAALGAQRMSAAIRSLDEAGISSAQMSRFEDALAGRHSVTSPSFYRNPTAVLPDGKEIPPDSYSGGYYGAGKIDIDDTLRRGLPARGPHRNIEEHALGQDGSAFRGTTPYAMSPDGDSGAVLWADEGAGSRRSTACRPGRSTSIWKAGSTAPASSSATRSGERSST